MRRCEVQSSGVSDRWIVMVVEIDRYDQFADGISSAGPIAVEVCVTSILQESARQEGTESWAEWISERRLYAMLWLPEAEENESEQTEQQGAALVSGAGGSISELHRDHWDWAGC